MAKSTPIQAEIIRTPNSVFVSVQPPEKFQQAIAAAAQPRVWAKVVSSIGNETPTGNPYRNPLKPDGIPTAEEVLAETLPGLYCSVSIGDPLYRSNALHCVTVFSILQDLCQVYHDPSLNAVLSDMIRTHAKVIPP